MEDIEYVSNNPRCFSGFSAADAEVQSDPTQTIVQAFQTADGQVIKLTYKPAEGE